MSLAAVSLESSISLEPEVAVLAAADARPALVPAVAMALRRAVHPEVTVRTMVELLAGDPLLIGQMLVAAGAQHPGPYRTVHDAACVLDRAGVAGVIARTIRQGRVFRTRHYGACLTSLRRHSRAVGQLAHMMAPHLGVDGREAYLMGLVHDVGFAGGLVRMGNETTSKAPPLADTWNAIADASREATATLCAQWGLHEPLASAIDALHAQDEPTTALSATLQLAHMLAQVLGADVVTPWGREQPDVSSFIYAASAAGIAGGPAREFYEDGQNRVADIK